MRTNRTLIYTALALGALLVGPSGAQDQRFEAVEALLLARWTPIPEDMVVEIVLDPVMGQSQRYRVLRLFLDRQKAVGRHRQYVQQQYLPRLEKMFREMPAEDPRSFQLILQGMASLQQERDQNDGQIREFLGQQLGEPALSPARRVACLGLLSEIHGQDPSSTGESPRTEERQIAALLSKGSVADAYRLALSILLDARRPLTDRANALKRLDQMLAYPTGVTFEQFRQDLTRACAAVQEPALATHLVGSIMRLAFLEQMDAGHVQEVLRALAQDPGPAVRGAAAAALAEIQTTRQQWGFDLQAHLDQTEALVAQANLDDRGRQEYRQLVSDPDYYSRPVGEAQRWWFLGQFFWHHRATKASVEAFRKYLQTREPCSRVDDYLREAVKILAAATPATAQDPSAYWTNLARLPKPGAVHAFVRALAEQLSRPNDKPVLVQFAVDVLQQEPQPELAQAILDSIPLSPQQAAPLEASPAGAAGRYCRTAIAAALAREGKSSDAVRYLDLDLTDPLPGVPLFRVIGVADALFADGKADAAETLVRSLLRRPGTAAQRTNLLVCLLNQHLQAGHTDDVLRIQEELSRRCSMDSPETMFAAVSGCIGPALDKNPQVAIALLRLACEILNGDTYPHTNDGPSTPEEAVGFWRSVLAWSQDNAKTEGLEDFIRRQSNSVEADLARVLLARCALDLCQADRAAELLRPVEDASPVSALAGEQRRRLQAIRDRHATLVSTIREQAGLLAKAAEEKGEIDSAVEAFLLLAEFGSDVPARMQSLSRAAELCERPDLCQVHGTALRAQLDAIRSNCEDVTAQTQCAHLVERMGTVSEPASQPGERDAAYLESPFDAVYVDAMGRIGMAFRTAGQYRRAVDFFHRGWQTAPLAEGAANLLKEEVLTLQFYLAAMEESQTRVRQLVAIYPHDGVALWARAHIGNMANPEHPE